MLRIDSSTGRIVSLDQFRAYAVLGIAYLMVRSLEQRNIYPSNTSAK